MFYMIVYIACFVYKCLCQKFYKEKCFGRCVFCFSTAFSEGFENLTGTGSPEADVVFSEACLYQNLYIFYVCKFI